MLYDRNSLIIQHVIARNTITPQQHSFVVQAYDASSGSGKAFLVYRPYFYNANGRFQVVLSADIKDDTRHSHHSTHHKRATSDVLFVTTAIDMNMKDICQNGASFEGAISTM